MPATRNRPRRPARRFPPEPLTDEEVGRLLGWAAKRAENLVYRGMADLRGCLGGKGIQH